MTDAHLHVMQRVFNDQLCGLLRTVNGYSGTPYVDFHSYLMEYLAVMSFAEFIAGLKAQFPEQPKIVVPMPEDVVVFGGA